MILINSKFTNAIQESEKFVTLNISPDVAIA